MAACVQTCKKPASLVEEKMALPVLSQMPLFVPPVPVIPPPPPALLAAPEPPPPYADLMITPDVMSVILSSPTYDETNAAIIEMNRRIQSAIVNPALKRYSAIESSRYQTVYLTSDIHSDFRKLVQLLKSIRLIDTPYDPYNGDDIYNPELITNARWIGGSGVMLVIIGDLVDGRRVYSPVFTNEPDDRKGVFELIQYVFLYNLQLRAHMERSDIVCTIGNHELGTVISNDLNMYITYVSDNAKAYFQTPEIRMRALNPFIRFWPHFFFRFLHEGNREIACVHGGLHIMKPGLGLEDITTISEIKQDSIDQDPTTIHTLVDYFGKGITTHPLWVRTYSSRAEGVCDQIKSTSYPFIIVGHCPTEMFASSPRFETLQKLPIYSNCSDGTDTIGHVGCVYLDCKHDEHNAPRLAFVDTAMSKGQRFPVKQIHGANGRFINFPPDLNNKDRHIEILRLRHDPSVPQLPSRYFNIFERVRTNGTVIQMFPAPAHSNHAGGRRRISSKRKQRRNHSVRRSTRRRRL